MRKWFLVLIPLLMLGACKQKNKATDETTNPNSDQVTEVDGFPVNPLKLPDPCELLDKDEIKSVFGIGEEAINYNPGTKGTGQGQENTATCFITWEKDGLKSGFVVQLMKNPLYGEFDNWASSYIDVLQTSGETSYPDNVQYKFTPVDGLGDAAVFNAELGKLFWRSGEELIFGLIFRNVDDPNQWLKQSKQLGKMMTKSFENQK